MINKQHYWPKYPVNADHKDHRNARKLESKQLNQSRGQMFELEVEVQPVPQETDFQVCHTVEGKDSAPFSRT